MPFKITTWHNIRCYGNGKTFITFVAATNSIYVTQFGAHVQYLQCSCCTLRLVCDPFNEERLACDCLDSIASLTNVSNSRTDTAQWKVNEINNRAVRPTSVTAAQTQIKGNINEKNSRVVRPASVTAAQTQLKGNVNEINNRVVRPTSVTAAQTQLKENVNVINTWEISPTSVIAETNTAQRQCKRDEHLGNLTNVNKSRTSTAQRKCN